MGWKDTYEYQVGDKIWKSVPPILLTLGTIGNLLSIVVLARKKTRKSSTAIYLITLACNDLLVLWTGLLRQWLRHTWETDVRQFSEFGCKLHVFLVYFGTQFSSWILVAVTSERFSGVWCPHKVKMGCNPATAGISIAVIGTVLACLNTHWFYGFGDLEYTFGNQTFLRKCTAKFENYGEFLHFTWPWIDLCAFCLIPFVILLTENGGIIIKVLLSHNKSRVGPSGNTTKQSQHKSKNSQMTAMLLTINTVFLICVTPISIYLIGEPHWLKTIETMEEYAVFTMWWAIVNSLMYTNHAINFIMYVLSGTRFRQEVKALFCGGSSRAIFGLTGTTRRVMPSNMGSNTEATQLNTLESKQTSNNQMSTLEKSRGQVIESVA